ncbi:hypothetical protein Mucpa_4464 [Mucilaginibacter paludis DSM 18603]|uniref:Uncharacterized protein n=1 Tax=Mucilaginibacter paludis DSM 18603 TaxID=714943 RepID=H1Y309_9SPHI|nr:hypothetical protein Mucpa_4464 [Mucilaginibacter paludis DSM 18603]
MSSALYGKFTSVLISWLSWDKDLEQRQFNMQKAF